jgi:hypothetical protein
LNGSLSNILATRIHKRLWQAGKRFNPGKAKVSLEDENLGSCSPILIEKGIVFREHSMMLLPPGEYLEPF